MPRHAKGPRLYLYRRKGREPVYIIRDGTAQVSTGCGVDRVGEATEALRRYLAETFQPNAGERELHRIPIAEVLTLYQTDIAPALASAATIGFHAKALLRFWGEKYLSDVKGSQCRKYANHRATEGVASSTARREMKTLQASINYWHRESPLETVPKVTLPDEAPSRERFLERAEAAAMLREARRRKLKHLIRFILIGLYTGTRHNAILRLHWTTALSGGHIDLERGILYRRGKGERETSKRRTPVYMPPRLVGHCRRWAHNDHGHDYVIHYQRHPIARITKAFAQVAKAAGLPDVTPHVLRHTFVTWELWKGRSLWDVAGDAGADATTIQKVYGHHRLVSAANLRRAGGRHEK